MKEYQFTGRIIVDIKIDVNAENEEDAEKLGKDIITDYLHLDYQGNGVQKFSFDDNATWASEYE